MADKEIDTGKYFYDVWFPKRTTEITIIAPPSYDNLEDAELKSLDYAFFDSIGDRDSVYAMGKLLSRQYPHAVIKLCCSKDFAENNSLDSNFVVIGGPGGRTLDEQTQEWEMLYGNEICKLFSDKIRSKISYSEDCEKMLCEGKSYESSYNKKRHTTVDYGYFAAFPNPYLKSRRVILIHGLHTLGVLGAGRLFHSDVDACDNRAQLANLLAKADQSEPAFETFFKVLVSTGQVECPEIDPEQLFIIRKESQQRFADSITSLPEASPAVLSGDKAQQLKQYLINDIRANYCILDNDSPKRINLITLEQELEPIIAADKKEELLTAYHYITSNRSYSIHHVKELRSIFNL